MSDEIPMPIAALLPQALILCFCAFVQSAVGFAFSLFSNTLLLFAGLALPEAVLLSTLGSTLQRALMIGSLWRHVAWRATLPLSAICASMLPVGILALRLCASLDIGRVKAGMGVLVLLTLAVQFAWQVHPRPRLHWAWGGLAAAGSGVLNGLANIGGPPLLLWVHAHDWPPERTRVTPMAITLLLVPFQLALMLSAFGRRVLPSAPQTAMLVPAILSGTVIGLAAGKRLSRARLRAVALGLLALIALAAIADPLLAHNR